MLMAELKVAGGKHDGKIIPLQRKKFLIGRGDDCQLRPASGQVSRHHCAFTLDDYTVRLRDLGSTDGTLVNGNRIRGEVILETGDRVKVGTLDFEVLISEQVSGTEIPTPAEMPVVLQPGTPTETTELSTTDTVFETPATPESLATVSGGNVAAAGESDEGIVAYLGQLNNKVLGLNKGSHGIGKAISYHLFKEFGSEAIRVLRESPDVACNAIPTLKPEVALAASRWLEKNQKNERATVASPQPPVPSQLAGYPQQQVPANQAPVPYPQQQPVQYPQQQPVQYLQQQPVQYPQQQPFQYPQLPGVPYPQQPMPAYPQQPMAYPQPGMPYQQPETPPGQDAAVVPELPIRLPSPETTGATDPPTPVKVAQNGENSDNSSAGQDPSTFAADVLKNFRQRLPGS